MKPAHQTFRVVPPGKYSVPIARPLPPVRAAPVRVVEHGRFAPGRVLEPNEHSPGRVIEPAQPPAQPVGEEGLTNEAWRRAAILAAVAGGRLDASLLGQFDDILGRGDPAAGPDVLGGYDPGRDTSGVGMPDLATHGTRGSSDSTRRQDRVRKDPFANVGENGDDELAGLSLVAQGGSEPGPLGPAPTVEEVARDALETSILVWGPILMLNQPAWTGQILPEYAREIDNVVAIATALVGLLRRSPGPDQATAAERALAGRLTARLGRQPILDWRTPSNVGGRVNPGRAAESSQPGAWSPLAVEPTGVLNRGAALVLRRRAVAAMTAWTTAEALMQRMWGGHGPRPPSSANFPSEGAVDVDL